MSHLNISSNPWDVSSLQDFQYFCCPECDSRHKDAQTFIDHAVLFHEQTKETLVNLHLIQIQDVLKEPQDYEYESDVIIPQEFLEVNIQSFIKQEIVEPEAKSDLVTDAKSDSRYECDQCPKSYKNKVSLDKHVRAKHRDSFKSFKCDICQKICGSQTILDYHVTTHYLSESTNKMLKCDHCSYTTYKGTFDFKKHLAEKHDIGEAKFKCDICNKVLISRSHLQKHKRLKHQDKSCESGIKSLNENEDTLDIKFKCEFCDKIFTKKRAWTQHRDYERRKLNMAKKQGQYEIDTVYKCDQCSNSYKFKHALKKHMQLKHDDDYSPSK